MNGNPCYRGIHADIHANNARRAVASIEFLMMMPVLVAFIAVTFWAARVLSAGIKAGQVAEEITNELAASTITLSDYKQLPALSVVHAAELEQLIRGFDARVSIDGGLVQAESTQDTGEGVKGVIAAAGPAIDQHAMLTHAWEAELFAFPESKADQPELTLPRAIRGIAPKMKDLNEFQQLLQLKGKAIRIGSLLSRIATRIDRSVLSIDRTLPQLQQQIQQINRQLALLNHSLPLDTAAISALQSQLDSLTKQEAALAKAQDLIDEKLETHGISIPGAAQDER